MVHVKVQGLDGDEWLTTEEDGVPGAGSDDGAEYEKLEGKFGLVCITFSCYRAKLVLTPFILDDFVVGSVGLDC